MLYDIINKRVDDWMKKKQDKKTNVSILFDNFDEKIEIKAKKNKKVAIIFLIIIIFIICVSLSIFLLSR